MVDNDGKLIKGVTVNNGGGNNGNGNGGGAPWVPQPPGCSNLYNELGTYLPWMYDNDDKKVFTCNDYKIGIGYGNSTLNPLTQLLNTYGFVVGTNTYFNNTVEFGNDALFLDNVNIDGDLTVLGNFNANLLFDRLKVGSGTNLPDVQMQVFSNDKVGICSEMGSGAPAFSYAFKAAVPGNNYKGIAVINTSLTSANCPDGEDVFRVYGNGKVEAKEVEVFTSGWCDYVFDNDYKLRSLTDLSNYIDKEGHLPEIPTTAEVEEDGVNLGEMNMLLLKKVEELTLYTLQQQKELDELKKLIESK